jgi:hypothetical protein
LVPLGSSRTNITFVFVQMINSNVPWATWPHDLDKLSIPLVWHVFEETNQTLQVPICKAWRIKIINEHKTIEKCKTKIVQQITCESHSLACFEHWQDAFLSPCYSMFMASTISIKILQNSWTPCSNSFDSKV